MLTPYTQDLPVLREAFAAFPCGVAAIAADREGEQQVLIASSFTVGVSQDPPLVSFAVQRSSTTWPSLSAAARLGVSILGEGHRERTRQLASRDKEGRFVGIDTVTTGAGAVLLSGAAAWMECSVEDVLPAGDHEIVLLRVHALKTQSHNRPLVWHRSAFTRLA